MPLLVQPLRATAMPDLAILAGLLTVVAMIPLAHALAERIETARARQLATIAVAALSVIGAISAILPVTSHGESGDMVLRWASIGAIPLLPAASAALPRTLDGP